MTSHLFGAGDPGAKAARDARKQAIRVKRQKEAKAAARAASNTK